MSKNTNDGITLHGYSISLRLHQTTARPVSASVDHSQSADHTSPRAIYTVRHSTNISHTTLVRSVIPALLSN